jgi:hypothetical protein
MRSNHRVSVSHRNWITIRHQFQPKPTTREGGWGGSTHRHGLPLYVRVCLARKISRQSGPNPHCLLGTSKFLEKEWKVLHGGDALRREGSSDKVKDGATLSLFTLRISKERQKYSPLRFLWKMGPPSLCLLLKFRKNDRQFLLSNFSGHLLICC